MSNTDSFIKDVFSISSIALAVLIIVSSIAVISRTPTAQGVVIDDGVIESVIPVPAIMIDQGPALQENADILTQLGDDVVMVHFVEFPPMQINAQVPLNN